MTTEATEPTRQEMLDKVQEIIVRARRGDASVVPLLRELMARHPALWQRYGDLAANVELSWIALAGGTDLLVRESTALYADKLRAELTRPSASPVERLLVERAVATWLQLQYFSGIEAADLDQRASPKLLEYRGKRQAQAQRMHEKALAALLVVQKLFPAPAVLAPDTVAISTPAEVDQQQAAAPINSGPTKSEQTAEPPQVATVAGRVPVEIDGVEPDEARSEPLDRLRVRVTY